jgi:acetoacetyl-CoA synthetase
VEVRSGEVIWEPPDSPASECGLTSYLDWLGREKGHAFADYEELWAWSVADLDAFWSSVWDFERVIGDRGWGRALEQAKMPGAEWFPGARVNYGQHLLRHAGSAPALICLAEGSDPVEWSWARLRRDAGALAHTLTELGVGPGDRVAGYLPNGAPAVIGLLACAAIGAIWSVCAPDFGAHGVAARFAQLQPKVLLAVDGYRWGGREYDRRDEVVRLLEELGHPHLLWLAELDPGAAPPAAAAAEGATAWGDALAAEADLHFAPLPFDHPLWVLFSSGTTGVPKGIVHGHGGILLEHLKQMRLQCDVRAGDRYLFVGSTSWMVWNLMVSALLTGATAVLLDGSPTHPELGSIWARAARVGATHLGVGAGYITACAKAGLRPAAEHDLTALRALVSTGSPLPLSGFEWWREAIGPEIWLSSASGGTDVCSAFVGSSPLSPLRAGRLQARQLGVDVQAWDEDGRPLVGETGELVVAQPMPSMPLRFWDDPDGSRYRGAYFEEFPAAWRHGDFIQIFADGSSIIHGRSDSTLNRNGVRMGSADIYAAVERLDAVREALVIGVELGDDYFMPLFVALAEDADADAARAAIVAAIRESLSPRHVPDEIIVVPGVPHTRTGKKLEVPIKRLFQGAARAEAFDPGSVDDHTLLTVYETIAQDRRAAIATS